MGRVRIDRWARAAVVALLAAGAFVVPRASGAQSAPAQQQAPLVFTGAMPDPAGSPCPDEADPARHLVVPPHITFPGTSAAAFVARNAHAFGVVVLAVRLDGGVGIAFPPVESFDDGMRAALLGFTKFIGVVPPIPGCAHPAGVVLLRFTVPEGAVTVLPLPPAPGASGAPAPAR